MKKLLAAIVLGLMMTNLFSSCGSGNPDSKVEELLECLKNQDYDAVMEMIADAPTEKTLTRRLNHEEYEEFVEMWKEELSRYYGSDIKSYEITDTEWDEEEEIGLYHVDLTVEEGRNEKVKKEYVVVSKKDGKWIPFPVMIHAFGGTPRDFSLDDAIKMVKDQ